MNVMQWFLLVFLFSSQVFAAPEIAVLPNVQTYDQLVHAIREARSASRARIEQAVDQEKVREAWEIGKLIDQHVFQHKERANYGEEVLKKLAKDLATSETELRYMLQFARTYPIHPAPDELSWSHYRELLSINDETQRKATAEKAVKEHWSHKRTRKEVRQVNHRKKVPIESLVAKPGKVGTYRIVKIEAGPEKGKLAIDLGFSNIYQLGDMKKFKEGDLVQASPVESSEPGLVSYNFVKSEKISAEDLFTYKVYVTEVIDGDTFEALIDLGFGIKTKQKLRLRGLDTPEIESSEGREAKAFLEKRFAAAGNAVLIKTLKSDKYDRYLADVWVSGQYFNQMLIDEGLAVRMED